MPRCSLLNDWPVQIVLQTAESQEVFRTAASKSCVLTYCKNMHIPGLHHITAISGAPQVNHDFYTKLLGLRLVKKTVNFDDPQTWHLYYGDETGNPGTLLTFFPFENAAEGKAGSGMASRIGFAVPGDSFSWWVNRIAESVERFDPPSERFGAPVITFVDPDGLLLEIMPLPGAEDLPGWAHGDIPNEHSIRCFSNATLLLDDGAETAKLLEVMGYEPLEKDGVFQRFAVSGTGTASDESPPPSPTVPAPFIDLHIQKTTIGRMGRGTVHHVAFRAENEEEQRQWREALLQAGLRPTEVVDRQYFKSIYFHEPGGVLFELATDPPGMLIDEDRESLGTGLQLPPWFEENRHWIEDRLPELRTR